MGKNLPLKNIWDAPSHWHKWPKRTNWEELQVQVLWQQNQGIGTLLVLQQGWKARTFRSNWARGWGIRQQLLTWTVSEARGVTLILPLDREHYQTSLSRDFLCVQMKWDMNNQTSKNALTASMVWKAFPLSYLLRFRHKIFMKICPMGLQHTWTYISKSQKGPWCPAALTSSTAQDRECHQSVPRNSSSLWDHRFVFKYCGLMVWSAVWDYSLSIGERRAGQPPPS